MGQLRTTPPGRSVRPLVFSSLFTSLSLLIRTGVEPAFREIVCVGPIIGSAAYALAATAAVQSTTATSVSLFTRMSVPPRFEARLDISTPGRRNRIRLASGRAAFSQDPRVLLRETLAE